MDMARSSAESAHGPGTKAPTSSMNSQCNMSQPSTICGTGNRYESRWEERNSDRHFSSKSSIVQ